jgi:predicted nucleic acid-binding protein
MASTCLLDSSVIIDAINDRPHRSKFLEGLLAVGNLLACCPVTEIYMGMRHKEAGRTGQFLASLEFYPVTWEIAKYAGVLYREWRQKGVTLALPDLTIAAFPMSDLRFYNLPEAERFQ